MNKLRKLFGKDVLRDFWHWFAKYQDRFYHLENDQEKLFSAISKKLKEIHPSLTFEFSPRHDDGTRELTISADGIKDAFPYVVQLVDRAPKIGKWKINAFRQRIAADDLAVQLGAEVKVGYGDIFFTHQLNDSLFDLNLFIRDYQDTDNFKSAIFILLDALVGEYDMEMKVGRLEFNALEGRDRSRLTPIVQLRSLVDAVTLH
jgi:hypothetical protein